MKEKSAARRLQEAPITDLPPGPGETEPAPKGKAKTAPLPALLPGWVRFRIHPDLSSIAVKGWVFYPNPDGTIDLNIAQFPELKEMLGYGLEAEA